jgi:hypothetical protein
MNLPDRLKRALKARTECAKVEAARKIYYDIPRRQTLMSSEIELFERINRFTTALKVYRGRMISVKGYTQTRLWAHIGWRLRPNRPQPLLVTAPVHSWIRW